MTYGGKRLGRVYIQGSYQYDVGVYEYGKISFNTPEIVGAVVCFVYAPEILPVAGTAIYAVQ